MGTTVTCPFCGTENPRSLLVTICQQCKRDMSRAPAGQAGPAAPAPATAPPPSRPSAAPPPSPPAAQPPAQAPARETPAPAPPKSIITTPPTVRGRPAAPPAAAGPPATLPPQVGSPTGQVACPACGHLNRATARSCARCEAELDAALAEQVGVRRCPRCGHGQNAARTTCEHCGLHFVALGQQSAGALQGKATSRVPRSQEEQTVTGCLILFIALVLFGIGFAVLMAVAK